MDACPVLRGRCVTGHDVSPTECRCGVGRSRRSARLEDEPTFARPGVVRRRPHPAMVPARPARLGPPYRRPRWVQGSARRFGDGPYARIHGRSSQTKAVMPAAAPGTIAASRRAVQIPRVFTSTLRASSAASTKNAAMNSHLARPKRAAATVSSHRLSSRTAGWEMAPTTKCGPITRGRAKSVSKRPKVHGPGWRRANYADATATSMVTMGPASAMRPSCHDGNVRAVALLETASP